MVFGAQMGFKVGYIIYTLNHIYKPYWFVSIFKSLCRAIFKVFLCIFMQFYRKNGFYWGPSGEPQWFVVVP